MNKSLKLISLSILPFYISFGQNEGQSGGGDSAAEASVTGSASQKAVTAPEALEGNPVVSFLKQGVSLQKVTEAGGKKALMILVEKAASFSEFSALSAQAKSNLLNLAETVSLLEDARVKGVSTSLTAVATRAVNVKALDDSGLTGKAFTDALAALRDTSVEVGDKIALTLIALADDDDFDPQTYDVTNVIDGSIEVDSEDTTTGSFSLEKATFVANVISEATTNNLTISKSDAKAAYDEYKSSYTGLTDSEKTLFEANAANVLGNLIGLTSTADDGTSSVAITVTTVLQYSPDELSSVSNIVDTDARHDTFLTFTELYDLQDGADNSELINEVTSAATLLNNAFVDRQIDGSINNLDLTTLIDEGTLISYNAADLASSSYSKKAASIAAGLGLFGKNSNTLLSELFKKDVSDISGISNITGFAPLLSYYTGDRDLGDNELSPYEIPLSNLTVVPGKNISLTGSIDLGTELRKAALPDNDAKPSDIKLLAFASAKDFTITGDLTLENENEVEDHALALVAGDDFYLRSEYSSTNAKDYINPDHINLTYEGSNLAIASVDSMYLVNVNIKTGGNLAIGTLDKLEIVGNGELNGELKRSSISAGTGGNTPNPDLVLLYANELITLNKVDFVDGMIREIHLDAPMMELRNLNFPAGTLVKGYAGGEAGSSYNYTSKERDSNNNPYLQFERTNLRFSGEASAAGDVILENTTHGSIGGGNSELLESHFDKTAYTGS